MEKFITDLKKKNIITTDIAQRKEDQNKIAFKKLEEKISDEECKQINESIKYYQDKFFFLGIQLWQNNIKLSQLSLILNDLDHLQKLTNLQIDIRQNKLGNNGTDLLTRFIQKQKNLTTLGLSLSQLAYLLIPIIKQNKNLIGEQGAQNIGYCIQDLPQLESLEIFLTDNVVGQDGFSILMSGVESLEKLSRFIMRAQNCRIKDVGASSMFYILSKKNTLKELIINLDANSLTNAIVEDYQLMMSELQHNLTVFELSICQNGLTTDGIKAIMESAVKPQNLERLRLFLCFNINTMPQFFPKELGQLTKLKILSLGFEDMLVGDIQAREIFTTISQLSNLHTMIIHLGQNVISQRSYLDFQKMIMNLNYLTHYYMELRDNNIMIRKQEINKVDKFIYERYTNILSAISYEKYIKPHLLYQSDFSHWDLSMS